MAADARGSVEYSVSGSKPAGCQCARLRVVVAVVSLVEVPSPRSLPLPEVEEDPADEVLSGATGRRICVEGPPPVPGEPSNPTFPRVLVLRSLSPLPVIVPPAVTDTFPASPPDEIGMLADATTDGSRSSSPSLALHQNL